MFYLAEALLLRINKTFSSHHAVIAAFGLEFIKTGLFDQKYHQYLMRAQVLRNVGDYAFNAEISEKQASEIISWAREFLEYTKKWLADH